MGGIVRTTSMHSVSCRQCTWFVHESPVSQFRPFLLPRAWSKTWKYFRNFKCFWVTIKLFLCFDFAFASEVWVRAVKYCSRQGKLVTVSSLKLCLSQLRSGTPFYPRRRGESRLKMSEMIGTSKVRAAPWEVVLLHWKWAKRSEYTLCWLSCCNSKLEGTIFVLISTNILLPLPVFLCRVWSRSKNYLRNEVFSAQKGTHLWWQRNTKWSSVTDKI